jgi:hypothetical protein
MKRIFNEKSNYAEFVHQYLKIHDRILEYHELRFNQTLDYVTIEDISDDYIEYSYNETYRGCNATEYSSMSSDYLFMDDNKLKKAVEKEKIAAEKKKKEEEEKKKKLDDENKLKLEYEKYLKLKAKFE